MSKQLVQSVDVHMNLDKKYFRCPFAQYGKKLPAATSPAPSFPKGAGLTRAAANAPPGQQPPRFPTAQSCRPPAARPCGRLSHGEGTAEVVGPPAAPPRSYLAARIAAVADTVLSGNMRGAHSVASTLTETDALVLTPAEEQLRQAVVTEDGALADAWARVVKHAAAAGREGAAVVRPGAPACASVVPSGDSLPPTPPAVLARAVWRPIHRRTHLTRNRVNSRVHCIACSTTTAFNCVGDGRVLSWDPLDPSVPLTRMKSQYSEDVVCCAVSPDGGTVVSGARDGKIRVWNARTGDKLHTRDKHAEWVLGIAFNADGSTFVSAGYDGSVRVWRTSAAECIASLKQDHLAVVCCGFSHSDNGRFVVAGTHVGDVFVWDHQTKAVRNVAKHSGAVWSCCFSSCDKFILSSSNSESVMLSDSAAETVLRTFTCTAPVHQAMFLGHGATHILSCGRDNAVTAWDAASGRKLGTFEGHTDHVMRMAVYAGEYLLTCSWDTTCRVWKLPDVLKDVVRAQAPSGHVPRTPPF